MDLKIYKAQCGSVKFLENNGGQWRTRKSFIRLWLVFFVFFNNKFTAAFELFMDFLIVRKKYRLLPDSVKLKRSTLTPSEDDCMERKTLLNLAVQLWPGEMNGLKTTSWPVHWDGLIKGRLLYCFSSIYYRSQIYTNMSLKCLARNTKQIIVASHNPLCFSPVSKVLILCLLL